MKHQRLIPILVLSEPRPAAIATNRNTMVSFIPLITKPVGWSTLRMYSERFHNRATFCGRATKILISR